MARSLALIAAAVSLAGFGSLGSFACSALQFSVGAGGGSTASATSSGAGGGLATSHAASSTSTATTTSTSMSTTSGAGGSCVATVSKAAPVPLDIFFMLDQSGSMVMDAGNGMSRWAAVKSALTTFMQQPNAAGIGMGIQYFGLPHPDNPACKGIACVADGTCTGKGCFACGANGFCQSTWNPDIDSCDPADYAWAEVPIQPLPGVGNAILSSMGMHAPGTNTPTLPALSGAITYASSWATAHPGHVTVVAFATDGEPGSCDVDLGHIDAIAAAGFAGKPSIATYVIGVGPSLSALDGIAAAGGTTTAFHVDMGAMATQAFLDAMNTIRGAALACRYQIPPPPVGMMEDFTLVNVDYKPGNGKPVETIPQVKGFGNCPANGLGWYYDDASKPTRIILCKSTCDAIAMDLKAEVDIALGCKSILN